MPDQATSTRRRLLQTTGTIAAIGFAGCLGSPAAGGGDGDKTTADVTTTTATTGETTTAEATEGDPDHSHHDGHHHEDVPDEPAAEAEVKMLTQGSNYHFSPHVVWVEKGGTVTFVNESGSHSATAYAPENDKPRRIPEGGTAFDSGLLTEQGATHEVTFETAGVYDYYCIPHETLGMIASVIVGEPDPHDQPGLSEPEELPEATHKKIRGLNETVNQALGHTHEESETTTHHDDDGHHDETTTHHDDDGHHDG